jgi:nucleoside-diphosphate-sugar epimerase
MARKLVVGPGYLGLRVARLWRDAGHEVHALTRSAARARLLQDQGLHPLLGDVVDPSSLVAWPAFDTVLFAIGFDRAAGHAIDTVYVQGLAHVIAALNADLQTFLYISSTGVYGSASGDWVDEDSPCEPVRDGGRACLAAERRLQASRFASNSVILRLAGIYGPDRTPNRAALERGEPIRAPADGWVNLIHVDDAATLVVAAEQHAPRPRTYVIADGHPVRRRDYYAEAARRLGTPPPRFEPAPLDPSLARGAADKRVRTDRMQRELPVQLAYPSYVEGLAASLPARPAPE